MDLAVHALAELHRLQDGAPVRLQDVAQVDDGVENEEARAEFNGVRSIIVSVQRQPDANTVEVTDAVKQLLPQFKADLPPTIDISILSDRTTTIRASVHDMQVTLVLSILLYFKYDHTANGFQFHEQLPIVPSVGPIG